METSQRNRRPARTQNASAPAAASISARLEELRARSLEAEITRLERLQTIVETNTRTGKPVTDRIYDLLRSNPDVSFSPAEIMECIHAPAEHVEAVRKALQRLCGRDAIVRVGHAEYRINMPPTEGLTP
jgi:hypothetical protein